MTCYNGREINCWYNTVGALSGEQHIAPLSNIISKGTQNIRFAANLLKLVHSEDAPSVTAMRANFLSEAGGHASIADGQLLWFQPLVPQEGSDRLLRGGNQVLLIHSVVIGLLAAFANHLH